MGLVSHRVSKEDIQHGDHIYTWRACYTYSHHGIYVGENKVVHFTDPTDGFSSLTASSHSTVKFGYPSPCPTATDCGFRQPDSGVVLSCVDCFMEKGSPCLFEYGVSTSYFHIKRPGTCTTAQPDPSETVIHRANYLLRHGFGNYDMFLNNCEDFAIYCKTGLLDKSGLGRSGQVSSVAAAALPIALLAKVKNSATVGVAVGAGLYYYCMVRLGHDIGFRTDMIKVPVEKLEVYNGRRRLPSRPLSLQAVHPSRGLNEIAGLCSNKEQHSENVCTKVNTVLSSGGISVSDSRDDSVPLDDERRGDVDHGRSHHIRGDVQEEDEQRL